MANIAILQARIEALSTQLAQTETVVDSAAALITGFAEQVKTAVTDALTADNAADDASITAASEAIDGVVAGFNAAREKLAAAVLAGTPSQPPAVS